MAEDMIMISKGAEFIEKGDRIWVYVKANEKTNASCLLDGVRYEDIGNFREPFDFRLHIFDLPADILREKQEYTVIYRQRIKKTAFFTEPGQEIAEKLCFDKEKLISVEQSQQRSNRGLRFDSVYDRGKGPGYEWRCELYKTPDGADVRAYFMTADPDKIGFLAGTPGLKPEFKPMFIQMVMEEANEAVTQGYDVISATNADFFDMFGDCHPSGLCVTRGITVANPDSENPFFAVDKAGKPRIATLSELPLENIEEAVGGRQIIVKDGKLHDTAVLESFGEVTHPRTAFGITYTGRVLVCVVDGRRPAWSNGAALSELAQLMIIHGAEIALNTDGGGSSTFIVKKDGELQMLNHPADLQRPMEDLIRPLFDTLILYRKK